jgi:hypothetical protein
MATRVLLGSLALLAAVVGVAQPASAVAPPPPPRGNVQPALEVIPTGEVGVVASSAPVDGKVAVIVQNRTTGPVRNVRVTATATQPDGTRATKVTTRSLVPSILAPDAIALAVLAFRPADVPNGATLSYTVARSRAPSTNDRAALDVGSMTLSPPQTGPVAQTLDVEVINPNRRTVKGPLLLRVMCFGEAALPSLAVDTTVNKATLKPGASMPAEVKLRELCPSYLVAARSESAR